MCNNTTSKYTTSRSMGFASSNVRQLECYIKYDTTFLNSHLVKITISETDLSTKWKVTIDISLEQYYSETY